MSCLKVQNLCKRFGVVTMAMRVFILDLGVEMIAIIHVNVDTMDMVEGVCNGF